ncbi:RAI1-domain-containing protein, partial [Saccharata proteae CBS 121410]
QEIAFFSYDDDHKYRLDDSSLKYYYTPTLGADLSAGLETFRQLDDSRDDHINALLNTIMEKEKETGELFDPDFITYSALLTSLSAFEMNATLFELTTMPDSYIEENKEFRNGEEKVQRELKDEMLNKKPEQWKTDAHAGYKFETLSLIPDIWDNVSREQIESRDKQIVSNFAQYCSIVRTQIGNSTMVIGGEVDAAVWDSKPEKAGEPVNYVELKTHKNFYPGRADFSKESRKFEQKKLRLWAQSCLVGVPKIIVGFRSEYGILERLEELDVETIPRSVEAPAGRGSWDGKATMNATAQILDHLKDTIKADGPGGVWRIRRQKGKMEIQVFKVQPSGFGNIVPPWFLQWRLQRRFQQNGPNQSGQDRRGQEQQQGRNQHDQDQAGQAQQQGQNQQQGQDMQDQAQQSQDQACQNQAG